MSAGLPHNEIAAQIARQAGLVDLSSVGHARKKVRELSPAVIAVPYQHGMPVVCCARTHRASVPSAAVEDFAYCTCTTCRS